MEWLWTWSGRCFGYRDGDSLCTHDGRHIGKFHGDYIYGSDGKYLGEVLNSRLITCRSKKSWKHSSFTPYAKCGAYTKYTDYVGYTMYTGYEDFPRL